MATRVEDEGTCPNGWKGIGATQLAGCAFALVVPLMTWLALTRIVKWDSSLWYLNWMPGAYSIYSFLNGSLGVALGVAFAVLGVGACVARGVGSAAVTGGLWCALVVGASNDGAARWIARWTGLASERCMVSMSRECVLNSFHRAYDLPGRAMTEASLEGAYGEYKRIREQSRVERPESDRANTLAQRRQQQELAMFAGRFRAELDKALVEFKAVHEAGA